MYYEHISAGLRNVLKTRNITYKDIAQKLGMSESGVKKMLTADDIGYNKLTSILKLLDIRLEDINTLASKPYKKLSDEQEKFFLKNPKHYNFFIQLHHFRMNAEKVKRANSKVSKEQVSEFLRDLEKIKVIKVHEGKIYSQLSEGFKFSKEFADRNRANYEYLVDKARKLDGQWKSWMFEGFGTFCLSQNSALELRIEMQKLLEEFASRSEREKKLYDTKELMSTGTLLLNLPMKAQEAFPIV